MENTRNQENSKMVQKVVIFYENIEHLCKYRYKKLLKATK